LVKVVMTLFPTRFQQPFLRQRPRPQPKSHLLQVPRRHRRWLFGGRSVRYEDL